eukprot:m.5786 g.5786  ORF g.5786 m.5786 type:complete len:95 (-) comp5087_c1_seq1:1277-1561(-)
MTYTCHPTCRPWFMLVQSHLDLKRTFLIHVMYTTVFPSLPLLLALTSAQLFAGYLYLSKPSIILNHAVWQSEHQHTCKVPFTLPVPLGMTSLSN